MEVFGFAGWSGSGKTTLVTRLIPVFGRFGVSVSTIKHAHHRFDIDQPGKDSHRHREAGANEVLVSSALRWALIHENRDAAEPDLGELLSRLSAVDLVLVEGFKREPHPKIEVRRSDLSTPMLCDDDPHIVAVASDQPLADLSIPCLELNDIEGIAQFILAKCGLPAASPLPRAGES